MKISNVDVYGLEGSIRAAKLPMCIDIERLTDELTEGIQGLAEAPVGSGHDNWLNGVIVQFDLTASLKFWPEFQRYHFADFVSSQSTIHKITKFKIAEQCNKYVTSIAIGNLRKLVEVYNSNPTPENYLYVLYNIPTGFELTARITTNYRQLKTIYGQRKKHILPEWRAFCEWIETLPNSELIVGRQKHGEERS